MDVSPFTGVIRCLVRSRNGIRLKRVATLVMTSRNDNKPMQHSGHKYLYFAFTNVIAAVLVLFSLEPLSETVEVTNEKALPILNQMRGEHEQQIDYVERMIASIQSTMTHTRTVIRVVAVWLCINAAFSWWCIGRQKRVRLTNGVSRTNAE